MATGGGLNELRKMTGALRALVQEQHNESGLARERVGQTGTDLFVKARPSLEKRRKELQRQHDKAGKAERRKERKAHRPTPGAGPPIEELTPGELGWTPTSVRPGQNESERESEENSGKIGEAPPTQAGHT